MNKILLLFLLGLSGSTVFSQNLLRNEPGKANGRSIYWLMRNTGCLTTCFTGKCDQGNSCSDYKQQRKVFYDVGISKSFYIKTGKLYLKEEFKKYLIGNNSDAVHFRLLDDPNDRLVVTLIPRLPSLGKVSPSDTITAMTEFSCKPISRKSLESIGDILIDELPIGFSEDFEVKLDLALYCSKMLCTIWGYNDVHHSIKKYVNSTSYPLLPMLIDSISAPLPGKFEVKKTIKLKIPMGTERSRFTKSEIAQIIAAQNEPPFRISKVKVNVFPTITNDTNMSNAHALMLANSFIDGVLQQPSGLKAQSEVMVENGWEHFKEKVILTNWYRLADSVPEAVRKELREKKDLSAAMSKFLTNLTVANVELEISFDNADNNEAVYWSYKFKNAIESKNLEAALTAQIALMKMANENRVDPKELTNYKLPLTFDYIPLKNNQAAYITNPQEQIRAFEEIYDLDQNNAFSKYNLLASRLNYFRSLPHLQQVEEMRKYIEQQERISKGSIPQVLYDILEIRYYPLKTDGRLVKRWEKFSEVIYLSDPVPASEVIKLADDYVTIGRYDIATQILFSKYEALLPEDSATNMHFVWRLLYYGRYSGYDFSENMYTDMLGKIYKFNPSLLIKMHEERELSYKLLQNKANQKRYLEHYGVKGLK
jgi:hypothetical protein